MPENIDIYQLVNGILLDETGSVITSDYSPPSVYEPSSYLLEINTNVEGVAYILNGSTIYSSERYSRKLSKVDLLDSDLTVRVVKNGYVSLDEYVISLSGDPTSVVIFNSDKNEYIGLDSVKVVVKKFVAGTEQPNLTYTVSSEKIELEFLLYQTGDLRTVIAEEYDVELIVNLKDIGVPVEEDLSNIVRLIKNGADLVSVTERVSVIKLDEFSTLRIESRYPDRWRLLSVTLEKDGTIVDTLMRETSKELTVAYSPAGETRLLLEYEPVIKLDVSSYKLELLNREGLVYNKVSKAGLNLLFRRNEEVNFITLIIGDQVVEYDNLGTETIIGINIPDSYFSKLGSQQILILPTKLLPDSSNDSVGTVKTIPLSDSYSTTVIPDTSNRDQSNVKSSYSLETIPFIPSSQIYVSDDSGTDTMLIKPE